MTGSARHEELQRIEQLKTKISPELRPGEDRVVANAGADRAEIAHLYERLDRHDDAVRWYLAASDFCSACGQVPKAYTYARSALKVNPLDPGVRERLAIIMAQLGLADTEA